jgi:signal transduction histidine kinase
MRQQKPPSLLLRITTRLSAMTLIAIALSYAWLLYQLHYTSDSLSEGSLIAQAGEIARSIRLNDGVLTVALSDDFQGSAPERDGKFRYAVTDDNGTVVIASKWAPAVVGSVTLFDSRHNLYQTRHNLPQSMGFFGAVVDASVEGRHFTISVERNSRHLETLIDTLLAEFFIHGAWVYMVLLVGLFLVSILTIRSVIRPVERLSHEAAGIGPQATEHRLSERGVPREIVGFVRAVNSALERLDHGFRMQREFTAAAAHELRTPLAVLRAHLDTIADEKIAGELGRDVDAMTRIVAQLLRVARLDVIVIDPNDSCDLTAIAVNVAARLIPTALARAKQIEATGTEQPVYVVGSADLVLYAVRNLVENAIAYSGSAPWIEIEVNPDGDLRVIDHGPGIPPDMVDRVFDRFWRGQRLGEGSGLGLYIVKRIMEVVGGRIAFSLTSGGGATFTLGFRVAEAPANPMPLSYAAE